MSTATTMMHFEAPVVTIKGRSIVKIPKEQSKEQLPSRGQVFVKGNLNGREFERVLEPDGYWSHWFRLDDKVRRELGIKAGDTVTIDAQVSKDWPEPQIPGDFGKALERAPQKVKEKWHDITAMARWEWIRWVNATNNPDTRGIRIEKSMSKLEGKHRRPCCFNLAACTVPELSKSGRLVDG